MIRILAGIFLVVLCTLAVIVPSIAISEFVINYDKDDKEDK